MNERTFCRYAVIFSLALGGAVALVTACSDDSAVKETPPSTMTDAGNGGGNTGGNTGNNALSDGGGGASSTGDGGAKDCFDNPTTHYEILNACTTAEARDKSPNLPLLLADGGLPPPPN